MLARKALATSSGEYGSDKSTSFGAPPVKAAHHKTSGGRGQVSPEQNRGETEAAMRRNENGGWKVVDQPCDEEGCDTRKEIARIRKAFPAAPAGIFPKQGR